MMIREGSQRAAAGFDVRLPTGDELNLLGTGAMGLRPFAAVSAPGRARAAREHLVSMERESAAGDVRAGTKANLPDQFQYAIGAMSRQPHFSMVFDVSANAC